MSRLPYILGLFAAAGLSVIRAKAQSDRAWTTCTGLGNRSRETSIIRGYPRRSAWGGVELEEAEISARGGGFESFRGSTTLPNERGMETLVGSRVILRARAKCSVGARNPAKVSDGLWQLERPRLGLSRVEIQSVEPDRRWGFSLREGFRKWIAARLSRFPQCQALVESVWLGETRRYPAALTVFFRESGTLAILALSGQHVACLLSVVSLFIRLVLRLPGFSGLLGWAFFRKAYPRFQAVLPSLCATLLLFTAGGSPPILRAFVMSALVLLARVRRFHCSSFQLAATTTACLIVVSPELVASASFLLSAAGTLWLAEFFFAASTGSRVLAYLKLSFTMPILYLPLSAFLFEHVSLLTAIHLIAFGWFWDLLLIPVGFVLPLVAYWPASGIFLGAIDLGLTRVWNLHLVWGDWVGHGYRLAIRPSWVELLVTETLICGVLLKALRERSYTFSQPVP